uniref:Uncharacterized protein n=1 Tax=Strigamia maritima TaxID=126957 RepID=T1IH19_STRMM
MDIRPGTSSTTDAEFNFRFTLPSEKRATLNYIAQLMLTFSSHSITTPFHQLTEQQECTQRLTRFLTDPIMLEDVLNIIFTKSVANSNTRLKGAQLCLYLAKNNNLGLPFCRILEEKCRKTIEIVKKTKLKTPDVTAEFIGLVYFFAELLCNHFEPSKHFSKKNFVKVLFVMLDLLLHVRPLSADQFDCFAEVLLRCLDVVENEEDLDGDCEKMMKTLINMLGDQDYNNRRNEGLLKRIDEEMKIKGEKENEFSKIHFKMAAIIIGLMFLFITTCQCSNYELPKGDPLYKLHGNSTKKLDWFKPAKSFIDLILSDDFPGLPENLTAIIKKKKVVKKEPTMLFFVGFSSLMTCILPIITPGVIYLFASSKTLNKLPSKALLKMNNAIDDAVSYLNNTKSQIDYVTQDAYNTLHNEILSELDITNTLGKKIQKSFDKSMNVGKFFDDLQETATNMNKVPTHIEEINDFWSTPEFQTIINKLKVLKSAIDAYCSPTPGPCDTDNLKQKALELPITNSVEIPSIDKTILTSLTTNLVQPKEKYKNIPQTVATQAATPVKELKDKLDNFKVRISDSKMTKALADAADTIESTRTEINYTLQVDPEAVKLRELLESFMSLIFTMISVYIMVVWLFLTFGVFFGAVCYQSTYFTEERPCGSHMGGLFLTIGVAILLIGSSPLWLISTTTMLIAAPGQEYVCRPLYDPEFKLIKEIISTVPIPINMIMSFPDLNVSAFDIKSTLENCEQNIGIYQSLNLDEIYNLDKLIGNYNIDEEIDKMDKTLDNTVKINTLDTPDLTDLSTLLNQLAPTDDISNTVYLEKRINDIPSDTGNQPINDAKSEVDIEISALKSDLTKVVTSWEFIERSTNQAKATVDAGNVLKVDLSNTATISALITKEVKDFTSGITENVKNYINFAKSSVKNDIGGCRPVWNVFDSFRALLCHDALDPLNGFWFSLGWCLFLSLPMSLVACKLSKHFRRLSGRISEYILNNLQGATAVSGFSFT